MKNFNPHVDIYYVKLLSIWIKGNDTINELNCKITIPYNKLHASQIH